MRSPHFAALLLGGMVFLSSRDALAVTVAPNPNTTWPSGVFSPYVDMTLWPTPRLDQLSTTTGVKHFNLAFLVADSAGTNNVAWGGYTTYPVSGASVEDASWDFGYNLITGLNNLRATGGDVTVSFGGANGTPIDSRITTTPALVTEYQRVIDTYKLTSIDLDIEGSWLADTASIARRAAAIKTLQTNNPNLKVTWTLPVLPTGLTADGVNVLNKALDAGVRLDCVNLMAMDYGDSAAPNPSGKMGDYAIQAATSTQAQLKTILTNHGQNLPDADLWKLVGLTPMIGVNDLTTEVFDLTEAQEVLTFANSKQLSELSFWSLNRDHSGTGGANPTDSGIAQTDYAFSNLYKSYAITPEPASLGLLGLGAMALLRRRKRDVEDH